MIVSYSQIIGSDVLSINEQKSVGKISDLVLQKSDLKVKAALLRQSFFYVPQKLVTYNDIIDFDNNAIVIQTEDNIVTLKEVIAVQKAIQASLCGINQKVMTKSGSLVGRVYDYTIDSTSGMIYSLYVHKLLLDKIIPRSIILELEKNIFLIEDDYELITNNNSVPETV